MPVTTVNVTAAIYEPDGDALANQAIEFLRRGKTTGDGVVIVPFLFTETTDASGILDMDLYPGDYKATVTIGTEVESFNFTVPTGVTTAELADLVDQLADFQPSLYLEIKAANTALAGFTEVYLGIFAASPTQTPSGSALSSGMLYYDTTLSRMRVYTNGWQTIESVNLPLPMTSGGHGGTTPAEARTALELGSAAQSAVGDFATASGFTALQNRVNNVQTARITAGTGNTYTITLAGTLAAGNLYSVRFDRAPTGAATLNGTVIKKITFSNTLDDLVSGDVPVGTIAQLYYDGTQFILPRYGLINDAAFESFTDDDDLTVNPAHLGTRGNVYNSLLGVGQSWVDVRASRQLDTSYQNTTGKPIMVGLYSLSSGAGSYCEVSTDNSTWVRVGFIRGENDQKLSASFIVPPNDFYRLASTASGASIPTGWAELR